MASKEISSDPNIFNIYTALDIMEEKCVRLIKGDFDVSKTYNNDPSFMAKRWKTLGAKFLHIIDLDGARTGIRGNFAIIEKIIKEIGIPAQVGGGIRKLDSVARYMDAGASRVILGSAAVKDPDFVSKAFEKYGPEKIVLALDCRHGMVAAEGWKENSKFTANEIIHQFKPMGLKYVVYTDIDRDGTLQGPNLDGIEHLLTEEKGIRLIASGGVGGIEDVRSLKGLRKKNLSLDGVIIGKALYENKINPKNLFCDDIYS